MKLTDKSDEELNVMLAELVGWTCINATGKHAVGLDPAIAAKGEPAIACVARIPNYCADLNAVAEVERTLDENSNTYVRFDNHLHKQCGSVRKMIHATARQRTVALIATLSTQ